MFTIVMLAVVFGYLCGIDDSAIKVMKVRDIFCMIKCISVAFAGDIVVLALNMAYRKIMSLIKR